MMKMKMRAAFFVSAALIMTSLSGCSEEGNVPAAETSAGTLAETSAEALAETAAGAAGDLHTGEGLSAETENPQDEENYDTGDASLDNVRNQDGIGENELLVVSFGTSYNDSRRLTIGAIEEAMEDAFPEYDVRRGFTSQIIIDHVKSRDKISIDNVEEALERAADNGVKNLVIQPTHLMNGLEYMDLVNEAARYTDAFEAVAIGEPLLTAEEDFKAVMEAITKATAAYDDGETAICFMGHGTEAESNHVYTKLQEMLTAAGYENYFVGTVEAEPTLEEVLEKVGAGPYKKAVLQPLMIVAGDHANNDMAGDEEDSWKRAFEDAGYEVTCLVTGLGEIEEIRQLFVDHAREAMESLAVSGGADDMTAQAAGQAVAGKAAAGQAAAGQVAAAKDERSPVYGSGLKDGVYEVKVDSSSNMFRITACRLTVKDGAMSAVLTMGGTGYGKLYMGDGAEAQKASEEDCIPYEETADGAHTFEVPVEALDMEIACSAFSRKKETWYDRTLVFRADSLPAEAFADGYFLGTEVSALEDGSYTAEVTLGGGSGRASVESPARIKVENGIVSARIVWGSSNYDYMKVDGRKYELVSGEQMSGGQMSGEQMSGERMSGGQIPGGGNSVFEIPVSSFDKALPVIADTIAMSVPHEIEYTLIFHSDTLKKAE